MSEQNAPMLSLSLDIPDPVSPAADEPVKSLQEPAAQPAPEAEEEKEPVRLDKSQLTEAEKKAIEDFIGKVDVTNPDHVLMFGADAQKQLGEFADSALEAVRTQDTGEVGKMLENLVVELRDFEKDAEEPKGIMKLFSKAESRIERMKASYNKVSVNVDSIQTSLEGHQVQLLKDVAMFDRMYDKNAAYFRQLTLYIIAGQEKLDRVRKGELAELYAKASASGDAMDAQAANDLSAQCDRFEKKLNDLMLTRHVALQTAPRSACCRTTTPCWWSASSPPSPIPCPCGRTRWCWPWACTIPSRR